MPQLTQPPYIRGRECIVHKVVYELRYHHGLTFLDRCGRTVNQIMKGHPEWTLLSDQPNPQNAPLVSMANSCQFNFNARKLDLSLERTLGEDPLTPDDIDQFSVQSEAISSIVVDQLGLTDFPRIGFRIWLLFATNSKQQSEAWLRDLGCFWINERVAAEFEGEVDAASVAVVVKANSRTHRIAFTGVERQAQLKIGDAILNLRPRDLHKDQRKVLLEQQRIRSQMIRSPEHAAMIDVDTYQEDVMDCRAREFIATSYNKAIESLERVLKNE